MTMLEKAARAVGEVAATMTDDVRDVLSEAAIERVARAVLLAVRESDSTVLGAGSDAGGYDSYQQVQNTSDIWTAMIDAILNEEPSNG